MQIFIAKGCDEGKRFSKYECYNEEELELPEILVLWQKIDWHNLFVFWALANTFDIIPFFTGCSQLKSQQKLAPKQISKLFSGVFLFDFGQTRI